jgi:hypothetical protein
VTSVLGLALGLPGGATAPPAPESFAATERLPLSVRPLPQHLEGSVIRSPTETSEIGALIRESLKPLTEMARQGIRLELSLPPSAVQVRAGWLAANEVLRILARRVLDNVYDGGVLSVDARLLRDRIIVEMAHSGGTVTAASPDTYPSPAEDPRFRRVRALLAGIGGAFILERQDSGRLSVWVALSIVQT